MDIFENIGKKASDTYKVAAEKTSKIVEIAKLKINMNNNKDKINDLYKKIGETVYAKHLEGKGIEEEYLNDCIEIDLIAAEVEEARQRILELNELRQCEKCHSEIDMEHKYCPKCGKKQPVVAKKEEKADEVVVPVVEEIKEKICECGCANAPDTCFCTECGKEL